MVVVCGLINTTYITIAQRVLSSTCQMRPLQTEADRLSIFFLVFFFFSWGFMFFVFNWKWFHTKELFIQK